MAVDTAGVGLHPMRRLVAQVQAALDEVGDPALFGLADRELDVVLAGLERVVSHVRARSLDLIAEGRRRNRAGSSGATTVTVWLSQLLHATPVTAGRLVSQSRALELVSSDPVTAPI